MQTQKPMQSGALLQELIQAQTQNLSQKQELNQKQERLPGRSRRQELMQRQEQLRTWSEPEAGADPKQEPKQEPVPAAQ